MHLKSGRHVFALVDCNNFFVSCERVFDPTLRAVPVMVLGSNDGCVVARSNEVKKLGIPMGMPVFKVRHVVQKHHIRVLSSNFSLYANMSRRIMVALKQFAAQVEVYSVDEAFLELADLAFIENKEAYGYYLRNEILRWTGVPVSVGIASTKTLAKAANEVAKKNDELEGVLHIKDARDCQRILPRLSVQDVWGIGRQLTKRLQARNIISAWDLYQAPDILVKKILGVVGARVQLELRGIQCFFGADKLKPKKGITSSRSFGVPVTRLSDLREAVASFVSRAAEKLRGQHLVCARVGVYIRTSYYKAPVFARHTEVPLPRATNYTPELITHALHALEAIFRPGVLYKKAGITLTHIQPETREQINLFNDALWRRQRGNTLHRLMRTMDALNDKWGADTLKVASLGVSPRWLARCAGKSGRFTTHWKELPKVK